MSATSETSSTETGLVAENARLRAENGRLAAELDAARQDGELLAFRLDLMLYGRSHTLDELLIRTLDRLEELTGSAVGFYHFINEDQVTLTLHVWSTATTGRFCEARGGGSHYKIADAGIWADCVRERRAVIHNDYEKVSGRRGLPQGHARVLRELVVPVFRGERIVAMLGLGNKPTDYTEADVEIVSRFADLAWDIAERKFFHEKLLQSEARFRAIADYSYDWELWIGPEGKIVWTNPACEDFTGYKPEELYQMEGVTTTLVKDSDREKFRRHLARALAGETANNAEIRFLTKDGRIKWGGIAYRPIRDEAGATMGFRASVRDMTRLKETEKELDRLNEKLIEMLAVRGNGRRGDTGAGGST